MNHYPWELVALLCVGFCLYVLSVLFRVKRKSVGILDTENVPFVSKVQTTQEMKGPHYTPTLYRPAVKRWLRNHC